MVIVNFPHNPTGFLPSAKEWAAVVEACEARGAFLLGDEMYRGLEWEASLRLPAAADTSRHALSLAGLSKTVGLPGLRIGWLACRDTAVVRRLLELKDYSTICSSAPSEILALAGLRAYDCILDRQLGIIRNNIQVLNTFFVKWQGTVEWSAPVAGTVAFPRLLHAALGEESVESFCRRLVDEEGVLLLPSTVYGDATAEEAGRFRLGFGRRNMPESLDRLGRHFSRLGLG
jgi:aspartate/methionine/tyrosine aminotransferase